MKTYPFQEFKRKIWAFALWYNKTN